MPSPTQPNTAQIALPSGLTLDEYYALQRKAVAVATVTICAVALAVWDYLTLLPMEVTFYRQVIDKRVWMRPCRYAFLILRYSIFFALIPSSWFTALQNAHCQAAVSCSQAGVVFVTGAASFIFCYRVFSIWDFNRVVCVSLGALYFIMIACWIAVVTQLRVSQGPPTMFGSNCVLDAVPKWAPINYASSVAFDAVILLLTIIGLRRRRTDSRIVRHILNDNVFYFVVVTITNLGALIIYAGKNQFAKTLIFPYPTLMITAMGSRVYLNLKFLEKDAQPNIWGNMPTPSLVATMQFSSNPRLRPQVEDDEEITTEHTTDSLNTAVEGKVM